MSPESTLVAQRHVAGAVVASIGGLLVHNLAEFPVSILFAPETVVPAAITVLLGAAMLHRPGAGVFAVTTGWAVVVVVVGGGSVLPLAVWPFAPEQTPGHYVAHAVYALAQLPLLWVGWYGFRAEYRSSQPPESTDSGEARG